MLTDNLSYWQDRGVALDTLNGETVEMVNIDE